MRTLIALLALFAASAARAEDGAATTTPPAAAAPAAPKPTTAADAERATIDDDGYRVSLSMPTEDDRTAWTQPGLRVEVAIERGTLAANAPAPSIAMTTFRFRPRVRLDPHWSLAANLGYAVASGEFTGLRWSALVEPIYHPLPSLGLSLGLGYGGFTMTRTGASAPLPNTSPEITSRTLGNDEKMFACSGGGLVSQARAEYLFVVGPLFSTGPYAVFDAQWSRCEESFNRVDRETGKPVLGTQWWLNFGGGLGWWFSWR